MPIDFEVDPKKVNIASMGHLNHQKGYDIMLDQLKPVCQKRKDLAVYILGDGKEQRRWWSRRSQNGLEDVVHFMGYQSNPYPYLNRLVRSIWNPAMRARVWYCGRQRHWDCRCFPEAAGKIQYIPHRHR